MDEKPAEQDMLLLRFKRGDWLAFSRIIKDNLYGPAFALTGDREQALNLAILTGVRLWENRKRIPPGTGMNTYIAQVMYEVSKERFNG